MQTFNGFFQFRKELAIWLNAFNNVTRPENAPKTITVYATTFAARGIMRGLDRAVNADTELSYHVETFEQPGEIFDRKIIVNLARVRSKNAPDEQRQIIDALHAE